MFRPVFVLFISVLLCWIVVPLFYVLLTSFSSSQLTEKGAEINGYMEKHNIQIRGAPGTDQKNKVKPLSCFLVIYSRLHHFKWFFNTALYVPVLYNHAAGSLWIKKNLITNLMVERETYPWVKKWRRKKWSGLFFFQGEQESDAKSGGGVLVANWHEMPWKKDSLICCG